MHVSAPEQLASELTGGSGDRHDVSATLVCLVAVRSIPIDTCEVHEHTGALTINDPVDPLGPDFIVTEEEPSGPRTSTARPIRSEGYRRAGSSSRGCRRRCPR